MIDVIDKRSKNVLAVGLLLVFWAGAFLFGKLGLSSLRMDELSANVGVQIHPRPEVMSWLRFGTAVLLFMTGPVVAWDLAFRRQQVRLGGSAVLLANVVLQWASGTLVGYYMVTRMESGGWLFFGLASGVGLPLWATLLYLSCRPEQARGRAPEITAGHPTAGG